MRRASGWLDEHDIQLATQKTEIVVLTKKRIETFFLMIVLGDVIMTNKAAEYLGITLDTKLTFFPHIKAVSDKAARVTSVLSGLMSNMSGAKQSKRRLLMSTVHCDIVMNDAEPTFFYCQRWEEVRQTAERVFGELTLKTIIPKMLASKEN